MQAEAEPSQEHPGLDDLPPPVGRPLPGAAPSTAGPGDDLPLDDLPPPTGRPLPGPPPPVGGGGPVDGPGPGTPTVASAHPVEEALGMVVAALAAEGCVVTRSSTGAVEGYVLVDDGGADATARRSRFRIRLVRTDAGTTLQPDDGDLEPAVRRALDRLR